MSPYLTFAIAMCAIIFIALAGTAYMAVYFNRRAKDDLQAALAPLAAVISGEIDLDEAAVTGRYQGHIAQGQVASLPGGMGRVFHTLIIDGAGGQRWEWILTRSKEPGLPAETRFEHAPAGLEEKARGLLEELEAAPFLRDVWFRIEYDPAPGHLRLTRPMKMRRDIPPATAFTQMLDALVALANVNRRLQGPEASARD